MKQQFSPDILALNPDLAQKAKKSRSVTPGAKGHHGHTPDIQDYGERDFPIDQLYRWNVQGALQTLGNPRLVAELTEVRPATLTPLQAALAALEQLQAAIGEAAW